jgi:hypothetical protein
MRTLYRILNYEAKSWWYHAQLRKEGQLVEARKRERASIRSWIGTLRQALASGGGVTVGRGGCAVHYALAPDSRSTGRREGYRSDVYIEIAKVVGLPWIDSRTVPDSTVVQTMNCPMVGVGANIDPEPWGCFSFAPFAEVARQYAALGAEVGIPGEWNRDSA